MSATDRFSRVNILCVGDVMIDEYVNGSVTRISPESPVPVFRIAGSTHVVGGAGNVARNIAALGGRVTLVGVAGADSAGAQLRDALNETTIKSALLFSSERPTTIKTRFTSQGQHVLRTDVEETTPIGPELENSVLETVRANISGHDIVVLSDYAKGVLTDAVVAGTIEIAWSLGIKVIVDPKSRRLERYRGASVITPNAREVFDATGIEVAKDDNEAERAGRMIIERASVDCVLITRGYNGVSCIARGESAVHFPASAREVFDVVGAGDTLVATLALALGAKEELEAASRFANVAAGVVVGKRGTATVSASELEDEIVRLSMGSLASLDAKIYGIHDLLTKVATWRRDGQRIGFTNGCFDLLHVGHLSLLNFARSQCDRLIVGLNGDGSARRLKGPTRPINSERDRAMVLAGMSSVNAVVIFGQDTPLEVIRAIAPDILVKGADYAIEEIVGRDIVLANGGKVLTCEIVPQKSTTRVINLISAEGN